MPQVTINIEDEADDAYIYTNNSATYAGVDASGGEQAAGVQVARSFEFSVYNAPVGVLSFNTHNYLPDDATVTAANLIGWVYGKGNTDSLSYVIEYNNWIWALSSWTIAPGNNAHTGTAISAITTDADNTFALTNLTNISTTAVTRFRIGVSQLASNAAPTGANYVNIRGLDHATDPAFRLVVTYSLPAVRLAPDAIISRTNLPNVDGVAANDATALAAIDEDPDSGGTDWLTV